MTLLYNANETANTSNFCQLLFHLNQKEISSYQSPACVLEVRKLKINLDPCNFLEVLLCFIKVFNNYYFRYVSFHWFLVLILIVVSSTHYTAIMPKKFKFISPLKLAQQKQKQLQQSKSQEEQEKNQTYCPSTDAAPKEENRDIASAASPATFTLSTQASPETSTVFLPSNRYDSTFPFLIPRTNFDLKKWEGRPGGGDR